MYYVFIAVEGQHDIALVTRVLQARGFEKIKHIDDVEPILRLRLVRETWPVDGDLLKRHPCPMFLKSATHCVVLHFADGDGNLIDAVRDGIQQFLGETIAFSSIGVIRDSDKKDPTDLVAGLRRGLLDLLPHLPIDAGSVVKGRPNCGVYVMPDNQNKGTLEDVLLACAAVAYPGLLAGAQNYIDGVDYGQLDGEDQSEIKKPAGKKKAVLGCVANVLKPGKSIVPSIDDNRWLEGDTLALPAVKAIGDFLKDLCELP